LSQATIASLGAAVIRMLLGGAPMLRDKVRATAARNRHQFLERDGRAA